MLGLGGLAAWEEPRILEHGCARSALAAVRQAANEAAERLGHEQLVAREPQQCVAIVGGPGGAGGEPRDARDRLGVERDEDAGDAVGWVEVLVVQEPASQSP